MEYGKEEYNEMKQMVLHAIRKNGACKPGYKAVLTAANIGIFCAVLKDYWADVINMHKDDSFSLFAEFYQANREGFNAHGIFFNESADKGYILVVGDSRGVVASGNARLWAFGTSRVTGKDKATVVGREKSDVTLYGDAYGQAFDESVFRLYGRSGVSAAGQSRVVSMGNSVVDAGEHSRVYGISWNWINGFGDAVITAHTDRKIRLRGNSTLVIEKEIDYGK